MTRIRSALRRALWITCLLATTAVATSLLPTMARADESDIGFAQGYEFLGSATGSDGTTVSLYQDDNGTYAILIQKGDFYGVLYSQSAGNYVLSWKNFKYASDPGPDDDGKGTEPINVVALIVHSKIKYQVRANIEDTPLAKWLDAYGGGEAPHWNPGDDGNDSGPATPPVRKNNGPTPLQKAAAARLANLAVAALQGIGSSMGDVDGLVGETGWAPPSNKGSGSNKGNGTNNSSSNKNNGIRHIFGSDLSVGPRPAVVNPPHSKTSKANLLAPGLLDRGSTFSARGPSATGALLPGGSGSITRGGPSAAGIR